MFRRTRLRIVNAARGAPVASMLVVALLSVVVAATAIAATSTQGSGPITAVKVVREEGSSQTSSTTFADVPGATTTITVPSGQKALILARFEANSVCFETTSSSCLGFVRILIGGVEGAPESTQEFNSTPAGAPTFRGTRSIERSRGGFGGLPAGTYQVKVQYRVAFGDTTLQLANWHLTAERSQIG